MSTSTNNESQTQHIAAEQHLAPSQALVQRPTIVDLPVHQDGHLHKNSNAAATVFGITELSERILFYADIHALRSTLPQVSKDIYQTIIGSVKLQRDLHNAPDWSQTKMLPAPIPERMITYKDHKDGKFDHDNAPPVIEAGSEHILNVRFDRDAIAWACSSDRSVNGRFRNMLICQPPVAAVEIFCWSTVDYKPKLEQRRIENKNGVTCGEMFDLVRASSPIGGNSRLTWFFSDRES